jgi:hypothetical protein
MKVWKHGSLEVQLSLPLQTITFILPNFHTSILS